MTPGFCRSAGFSAWISGVRLLPLDQSPALLRNALPENTLAPDLGMMFITGPPMSLSPSPPPTVMAISSVFTVS
jgi:hypothetical protein